MQEVFYNLSSNSEFMYLKNINDNDWLHEGPNNGFLNHSTFQFHLTRKNVDVPMLGSNPNDKKYCQINYIVDKLRPLTEDNKAFKLFRSVIFNPVTKHVVSFAPPKSIPYSLFRDLFPSQTTAFPICVEEIVEGTMINLFWDSHYHEWEIATRHQVGARSKFFTLTDREKELFKWPAWLNDKKETITFKKTFREMFFELLRESELTVDMFDKRYAYTFVMQHVENKMVLPIDKNRLYLVEVYVIYNSPTQCNLDDIPIGDAVGCEICLVQPVPISSFRIMFPEFRGKLFYPRIYSSSFGSVDHGNFVDYYARGDMHCYDPGIMIRNLFTNDRVKVTNPNYERVRELKGNRSLLKYRYFEVTKEAVKNEFLRYFNEFETIFGQYDVVFNNFVSLLYNTYRNCYIVRTISYDDIDYHLQTHMRKLHRKYRQELQPQRRAMSMHTVFHYVSNMPTKKLAEHIHL